jgi:hypothetical protein
MLRLILIGCMLFPVAAYPHNSPIEDHILVLFVTNTVDEQVDDLTITCAGDCSQSSAVQGKVRIKLPPQTRPGDWVSLQIIKRQDGRARGADWALISPWDNRVMVPSFENKADNAVPVVVARRGDKQILSSGKAVEALANRVLSGVTPKLDQQISDEERRMVLKLQAEAVGLTPEEVDRAIREAGAKTKDLNLQAKAALYEKRFGIRKKPTRSMLTTPSFTASRFMDRANTAKPWKSFKRPIH